MTNLNAPIGVGDEGAGVRLLHVLLSLLDFDLAEEEAAAGRYGERTAEAVQRFQESQRLKPTGTIDDRTAEQVVRVVAGAPRRAAFGQVLHPDGSPRPGSTVRVLDRNLDGAHQLGVGTTDDLGWFVIRYDLDQLGRLDKPAADLVVSAHETLRASVALAESAVTYGASPAEMVELTVPSDAPPLSEYEDLVRRIEPALGQRGLADLTAEDVEYLAGTTSVDARRIGWLAESARRAVDDVPAEAYYAWLQSGLVPPGGRLLAPGKDELLAALAAAVEHAVVPAALGARTERLARALDEARTNELVAAGPDAPVNAVLGLLKGDEAFDQDATRHLGELMATRDPAAPLRGQARDAGLSEAQVEGLRGIAALHAIVDGDQPLLVAGLATAADRPIPASLRVAALREANWARALEQAGRSDGDDARAAEARRLTRRQATLMPDEFLLVPSVLEPPSDTWVARVAALEPVASRNGADAVRRSFDDLDVEGVAPREVDAARGAHAELRRVTNYYPGLRLDEVLASADDPATKAAEISRRVGLVAQIVTAHPDVDFLGLDYLPDGNAVEVLGVDALDEQDATMVVRTLKAYQRVHRLADDALLAQEALEAGFDSASSIARVTLDAFSEATGMPRSEAALIYVTAQAAAVDAGIRTMVVYDLVRPLGGQGVLHTLDWATPEVGGYLRRLEGFDKLFDQRGNCDCTHCQSVLSPGAYFVDLMRFVDQHITRRAFVGGITDHRLKLRNRRPDLWAVELTCANTDTLIPYLDIVNEILENAVARDVPDSFVLRSRLTQAVYAKLATAVDSFEQPFVLSLRRLDAYLGHFDRTRGDVAKALGVGPETYARARLDVALPEWDLLTQTGAAARLQRLYGAPVMTGLAPASAVDLQRLVVATGCSRDELGRLLATRFVRGANAVTVQPSKTDGASIQNDIEVVTGLDAGVLDRLHRFTRLWRKVGWSIEELDLVLGMVAPAGTPVITAAVLVQLATLLDLEARFEGPVEELCALFAAIPTVPAAASRSLFDRLFNLEPFVSQDGPWPNSRQFTHPANAGGTSQPDNRALQRLLAGLQVDDQELVELIAGLALGQPFPLDAGNLTLLYRHARLARLLHLTVPQFVQLTTLAHIGSAGRPRVGGWVDLLTLVSVADRWRASSFTLDELGLVTNGPVLDDDALPDPAAVTASIAASIRNDHALDFSSTVFSQLAGVTEANSRDVVAANAPAFVTVAGSPNLRLAPGFDPRVGRITVPTTVRVNVPAVRALLDKFHTRGVLPGRIAAELRATPAKVQGISALIGQALEAHDPSLVRELHGSGPAGPLATLLRRIVPVAALFKSAAWDAPSLEFVATAPTVFGLTLPIPTTGIGIASAFDVAAYVRWSTATDPDFTPDRPAPDPRALRAVLGGGFGDDGQVARALRVPRAQLAALKPHVTVDPARPFETLQRLANCLNLAGYLGISGETVKLIVPTATDPAAELAGLGQAAEGLYGVIRAKYPDEQTFFAKIEPHEDQIRGLKRRGLVEYLIRSVNRGFRTPSDLYAHFLIDTQVEGCARTSRVVAAASSVQLYVHRVLMNLEQDDPGPQHVHVLPGLVPGEWEWRKNYRVWEANRKVFLYPENYLEPELRDDKTPLFQDLEAELLEQRIGEQSATGAYARYVAGFDEVARLRIAGAFHDMDGSAKRDVLHLFGATAADPPVYYYRAVHNLFFSQFQGSGARLSYAPWQPLKVQVPARSISPITHRGTLYIFWDERQAQAKTGVSQGTSTSSGYTHKVTVRYASLKVDGTWTAPQRLTNPRYDGPTYQRDISVEFPRGSHWERVFPGAGIGTDGFPRLYIIGAGSGGDAVDTFRNTVTGAWFDPDHETGLMASTRRMGLNQRGLDTCIAESSVLDVRSPGALYYQATSLLRQTVPTPVKKLLSWTRGPDTEIVNGAHLNCVFTVSDDTLLLHDVPAGHFLRRLGTTASETMAQRLATGTLGHLLSLDFQERLTERAAPVTFFDAAVKDKTYDSAAKYRRRDGSTESRLVDFAGPYGVYFREVFFHIPFLVANHLNSQQRFSAAQRWYHYIFDPTSSDVDADRAWRYREFRGRTPETLRKMLADEGALAAYRQDPFNPHAIARMRLSAYQKAIVMKYIDNLLDWGDSKFTEFTMESVNEATMLYVMAADILGPRPPQLGSCGEGKVKPKSYAAIAPRLNETSDFLIEMEHVESPGNRRPGDQLVASFLTGAIATLAQASTAVSTSISAMTAASPPLAAGDGYGYGPAARPAVVARDGRVGASYWRSTGGVDLRRIDSYGSGARPEAEPRTAPDGGPRISLTPDPIDGGPIPTPRPFEDVVRFDYTIPDKLKAIPGFELKRQLEKDLTAQVLPPVVLAEIATAVTTTSPVFCVPQNKDLLGYWDRVESRLFQIRNCMDITGARRQLSLFAPAIDPRLLVRARAAGLSLDDVLSATTGNVPPYRFSYLIDKAQQFASAVQSLGSALLSALEKKDAEELNRLRTVHEQNILKLRTRVQEWELQAAQDAVISLERQCDLVEYRRSYYQTLAQSGLTSWERSQQISRHIATGIKLAESIVHLSAAIFYLIPQVGSPFAMKYGGQELGHSGVEFAQWASSMASIFDAVSDSAGLEATFERRDAEWKHQAEVAGRELAGLAAQIEAAKIRVEIAERTVEIHSKTIEQTEEIFEYFRDKFTNFGLYNLLAVNLHRLHRDAFNAAFAMAKMAEQAYRFERPLDNTMLDGNYWDASQAGLHSGDRLLLDLGNLERRYLETNYRRQEVEQYFTLRQFDPAALITLQETGECSFKVPEVFFDLAYPGHYRRVIKAVRVTIPCVAGPYTSIGATLRLTNSQVRSTPTAGLTGLPLRHSTVVATSAAQSDAGVFEFSFRDERYMPFEGAGAVSDWTLTLPKAFRPFDYTTISDVVLRLSYEADESAELRAVVEARQNAQANAVSKVLESTGIDRVFSLRHEFSNEWHRFLVATPASDARRTCRVDLAKAQFPYFLRTKPVRVSSVRLLIKVEDAFRATHGVGTLRVAVKVGTAIVTPTLAIDPESGLVEAVVALAPATVPPGVPLADPLILEVSAWLQGTTGGAASTPIDPGALSEIWLIAHATLG